jgi:hypothetical protein
MYTDTMCNEKVSARGKTYIQLFVTSEGFLAGQLMGSKAEANVALDSVCRTYGIPQLSFSDNANEETLGNWGHVIKQYLIKQRLTEPPIKLGQWLGIEHKMGSSLTYWILKENGIIVARSSA